MRSQSLPTPCVGRKRRLLDETEPHTPTRRRRVATSPQSQDKNQEQNFCKKEDEKPQTQKEETKPGTILSPTDVSDAAMVHHVRTKQTKARGLPKLSLSPPAEPIVIQNEEVSELEAQVEAEVLTPRPTVCRRKVAQRPPLSRRRAVGLNRARLGVGIVRCRSWRLNGEETETETEDESPAPSPRRAALSRSKTFVSVMEAAGCGCSCGDAGDEKLEDQVGTSVLPIDPSLKCFDRSYKEDPWQLHSLSPDEEFVPETTSVEKTLNDDQEQHGLGSEEVREPLTY